MPMQGWKRVCLPISVGMCLPAVRLATANCVRYAPASALREKSLDQDIQCPLFFFFLFFERALHTEKNSRLCATLFFGGGLASSAFDLGRVGHEERMRLEPTRNQRRADGSKYPTPKFDVPKRGVHSELQTALGCGTWTHHACMSISSTRSTARLVVNSNFYPWARGALYLHVNQLRVTSF